VEFELNPVLHQPVRTKIMAYLGTAKEADFTTLKKALGLTDGHMSTHMKLLLENGYVVAEKEFVENKPRTTYRMTAKGKQEFAAYIATLKQILA